MIHKIDGRNWLAKKEKKLKVKVNYDPTVNRLVVTSNAKDIVFTNISKESEDKNQVKDENSKEKYS